MITIKEGRISIRLSQADFANLIGVSQNRLFREETYGNVFKEHEKENAYNIIFEYAKNEIKRYQELLERL